MGWTYIDSEILKTVDLFQNISERSLQEIIVLMSTLDVKTGQFIFREGDEGDGLYLVLNGEVRISKNIPGIGEEALAFLPAGACFGEMTLIEANAQRGASAIANSDCELAKLDRADFLELMEENKDIAVEVLWGFVRTLTRRLANSNDKVTFLAMSSRFE